MKIAIIGSTRYEERMHDRRSYLLDAGHQVRLPFLDRDRDLDELGVCSGNRDMIEWADEIHVLWDGRSVGTIFDLGMAFALRKRVKIIYLEPKDFRNFVKQYAEKGAG